MSVTAPPRPPDSDDLQALEALIEEARRRARRRRMGYAAISLGIAAAVGTVSLLRVAGDGSAPMPEPAAARPLPAPEIQLEGARLAYVPPPGRGLYVTNADGSGARRIAGCTNASCMISDPVWSPSGKSIAFMRGRRGGAMNAGELSLFVIGADGADERLLSRCPPPVGDCGKAHGSRPAWSPDGTRIALSLGDTLAVVDTISGFVRQLTTCASASCNDASPAWSPDATAIAFTRGGSLYRIEADGSGLRLLAAQGFNPAWSPDGRAIAFDAPEGLFSVAPDGSRRTLLARWTTAGNGPGVPSWSPRGDRVLYGRTPREARGYVPEVWTTSADGRTKTRVYRGSCCITDWFRPAWSADGRRIALAAGHSPEFAVLGGGTFVVEADGSRLRNLHAHPVDLDWQPTP